MVFDEPMNEEQARLARINSARCMQAVELNKKMPVESPSPPGEKSQAPVLSRQFKFHPGFVYSD